VLFVEFIVHSNIDVTSRPLVFCDDQQMTTYGMSEASSYSLGNMTILPDEVSRSMNNCSLAYQMFEPGPAIRNDCTLSLLGLSHVDHATTRDRGHIPGNVRMEHSHAG